MVPLLFIVHYYIPLSHNLSTIISEKKRQGRILFKKKNTQRKHTKMQLIKELMRLTLLLKVTIAQPEQVTAMVAELGHLHEIKCTEGRNVYLCLFKTPDQGTWIQVNANNIESKNEEARGLHPPHDNQTCGITINPMTKKHLGPWKCRSYTTTKGRDQKHKLIEKEIIIHSLSNNQGQERSQIQPIIKKETNWEEHVQILSTTAASTLTILTIFLAIILVIILPNWSNCVNNNIEPIEV